MGCGVDHRRIVVGVVEGAQGMSSTKRYKGTPFECCRALGRFIICVVRGGVASGDTPSAPVAMKGLIQNFLMNQKKVLRTSI
jgi:hypothetical protein